MVSNMSDCARENEVEKVIDLMTGLIRIISLSLEKKHMACDLET